MNTYTIDNENNIRVFATPEEAASTTATPFDAFSNERQLAGLMAGWPEARIVEVWNTLPGVKQLKKVKNDSATASRIWKRIQRLGQTVQIEGAAPVKAERKEQKPTPKQTRAQAKTGRKTGARRKAAKVEKAKAGEHAGPRPGTKTAQVIQILQRKNGATLTEIMDNTNWQRHTVRGFMAGAMKRAGFKVESFQSDRGERTYRLQT